MVLLRFAPSPTGPLHLGGLRMALYNHLFAKKHGGKWLMRIEDTDRSRLVPGSVEGIRKALEWAGLDYDYGPGKAGPHGPYFQSERLDLYRTYAGKLMESGHAYRCFCTPDELAETKGRLARKGSSASYDRKCLHLTEEEVARKVRAGEKHIVRFNSSEVPTRPQATDLIFGRLKDAHASLATDPVLLKTDLFPTYHLASVVDDHEMGITHVLRGEEWLPSLPLHLDLYASLKIPSPTFGHMPILLNPDGSKMSKRYGDVRVEDFMKRGWEPAAVLNWAVLSGWGTAAPNEAPPDATAEQTRSQHFVPESTRIMTLDEMIDQFDISAITHRNTILEASKLEYINKNHIIRRTSTPEGLQAAAEQAHSEIKAFFPLSPHTTVDMIEEAIELLEGRLTNLYDIPKHAPYLFDEPDYTTDEAKSMSEKLSTDTFDIVVESVRTKLEIASEKWDDLDILNILLQERDTLGLSTKAFMKPLRYAITGMKDGPGLADIMKVLGRERTLARLK
ncbi:glutamyl-tRNA synthetase [Pholiota conissans]|uniref:Glutamate--tRNA ligase, mitochondrial n=1 Tax=Pholiota conissans TaxID=109636 RepID=A0A9P6D2M6_9AGAR|nr:glutamyl-tRNA synthetase [Pholiota conissans]